MTRRTGLAWVTVGVGRGAVQDTIGSIRTDAPERVKASWPGCEHARFTRSRFDPAGPGVGLGPCGRRSSSLRGPSLGIRVTAPRAATVRRLATQAPRDATRRGASAVEGVVIAFSPIWSCGGRRRVLTGGNAITPSKPGRIGFWSLWGFFALRRQDSAAIRRSSPTLIDRR